MEFKMFNGINKKRVKAQAKLPEQENAYLNARRTWNEHEGSILSEKRMWQSLAILCLLIALGAVGGVVHIGQQSKFVPFVSVIDQVGNVIGIGPADRASPVDQRVIHASVAGFINDARLVSPDVDVQRNAVFRVYSMLNPNDAATAKMNEWLNGSPEASPFKRATKETVSVEITSVIPQSAETWQVEWREVVRDRQGAVKEKFIMRALVTVYVVAPDSSTTLEQMRRNPLGIYVREFSWSKQI